MSSNKNKMIGQLLKHYKVESVKWKFKSMKDHAHFEVETGTLLLSSKYKEIDKSTIKDFLITIIHEIDHAMMSKKYGWKKFHNMWETEANMITQGYRKGKSDPYGDNMYEVQAEKFGQKNYRKWLQKFKKDGYID